jgi:cytosine/adenosine deaminase-related metal-dependent hydrolase
VSDVEQAVMADRNVKVMHCPGSNLKLGSGIAPVAELRARGLPVSLGADGALKDFLTFGHRALGAGRRAGLDAMPDLRGLLEGLSDPLFRRVGTL